MKLTLNNPYRILGLLVGATAKEQNKQINKLKKYLDAEQEPEDDFSFPILGKIYRNVDNVTDSAANLSLDIDKMNAALFWFYNANPITDEPALDALKDGDIDQAINIWSKLTLTAEVTQRNASAHSNLGTLYISQNTNNDILEKGISLKLKFLESDFIKDFKALATDETYKTTKKELQLLFLNQLQLELEKNEDINSNKFLEILNKQDFIAKEDFLKGFVQKPIEQIEKYLEEAKTKRKANNANSVKAANSLLAVTKDSIKQLKLILGVSNIKYVSISDKLAMEFFACGRDYFMHYKDTDTDPSDYSMKLFKKAKSYAVGNIAKQQIDENIKDLQEWIDNKPERDKHKKVEEDLKFITSKLERFQNLSDTVTNAKDLVDSCKPNLANIKYILGSTDEFYLKISSAVANNALGMLVTAVNTAQESVDVKKGNFTTLRSVVRSALSVSVSIGSYDLASSQRMVYSTNHTALKSIATKLGVNNSLDRPTTSVSSTSTSRSTKTSSSSSSSSSFSDIWFLWVIGIGAVIGLIAGGVEGLFTGVFIGVIVVGIIFKIID